MLSTCSVKWLCGRRTSVTIITKVNYCIIQPQTLLLTEDNLLKTLEEVEEVEPTLIEDYNLDPTKVGTLTPERKQVNGFEPRTQPKNNNISTPRKLIMTPDESETMYRNSAWKVIGATDMAGM